ncbi:TDT family transporter [Nocardioides sp.]|uniref:TDT family transporter n=1 Tax=Nocardioides sp. TaxID=35761 RepID=UPI003D14652C
MTTYAPATPGRAALACIGPNWFASVMGTGIVAIAGATLPFDIPGLTVATTGLWLLAGLLLVVLATATLLQWALHPEVARGHLHDPVLAHFYGAPAMALLTVGAGSLLVGTPVLGDRLAVGVAGTLWVLGTALGLATAVLVPIQAFTTHPVDADSAFGGWLMPVVPPMVSAATGPLLIPHLPAGQWQLSLQLVCTMMFGLSLVASLVIITLIWSRLVQHKVGAAAAVPTLWIVLGPLGQSITAAHHLGATAPYVLDAPYGSAFGAFALVYGLPVWGFAALWCALALALTVRTVRDGLPFTLTWWSFTFPVGTFVTGTSGLAQITQAVFLQVAAGVLYAALVVAWAVVATRTLNGVRRGSL